MTTPQASDGSTRRLAAIMFADMVGYTALMQEDEQSAKTLRDRQKIVVESAVRDHAGEVIQWYGDGSLSIFGSALQAVRAAGNIQEKLLTDPVVPLRIGLHLGDIMKDGEGIFGDGVNIASRIESLAVPGAVLWSEAIQSLIANQGDIKSVSLGEFKLKNVSRPVGVYALANGKVVVPAKDEVVGMGEISTNERRVMVLPFVNLSQDLDNQFFCDGITEEIINGLSRVGGLSVIARSSSFRLHTSSEAVPEMCKKMGVTHTLEGSVRKHEDRVRISVQFNCAADRFQIWSETYDRQLANIFDLQDEIARMVVNKLRENMDGASHQKSIIQAPTDNLDAYHLYLKGLHHFNKRNPEQIQLAKIKFESVLALDPSFTEALTSLSHCYAFLGSCGVLQPMQAYAKAHEFALKAVEKGGQMSDSYLALATIKFFHFWDWDGCRESLIKAEELGLGSALLNQIWGLYLAMIGDLPDAIGRMQRAIELDPLSLPQMNMLAILYLFNGEYQKAIQVFDQILELDSSFRSAFEGKGFALLLLDRMDEALEALTTYQKMTGHPLKGVTCLIVAHSMKGDEESARTYFDKLMVRQEQDPNVSLEVDFAIAHYALGEMERSIDYLEKAYEKRFGIVCTGIIFVMRLPYFNKLWKVARFQDLARRMDLTISSR